MRYLKNILSTRKTPQTAKILDRPEQVKNSAGGFVWAVDNWKRLERFLILGSENGTYYITEQQLTVDNAKAVAECLREDGHRVIKTVVEISASARAPKNDPALFVLAMAASPKFAERTVNSAALAALPTVARTASHLCTFAAFAQELRGWGRGLRTAIGRWYLDQPVNELAYQMVKYQSRNGWAHRDLLRMSHPKPKAAEQNALFQWAIDGKLGHLATHEMQDGKLRQLHGFELARKAQSEQDIAHLIHEYRLTHEMIPSEWKNSPAVWDALMESMPYMAMVRNLGKMTAIGLLAPQSETAALVVARLIDGKRIERSKVHPIALLAALLVYKQGHGVKGGLKWAPVANVIDALDEAFYLAFQNVEPTGARVYVALDASGSMQGAAVNGMPFLTAAMGSVAMGMVFARTEKNAMVAAFHEEVWNVDITKKDRLDRACEAITHKPVGTDASLPMKDAMKRGLAVDAFVVMTDSETWAGDRHPVQALADYRKQTGIPAKLVVMAMAANQYTIADPNDAGQMDVVGFDSSVPAVVSDFIRQ